MNRNSGVRLPAEWEEHKATWLAWPHNQIDFPKVLPKVKEACANFIKQLSEEERVKLICENELETRLELEALSLILDNFELYEFPTDRSWLRDSAPTAVKTDQGLVWTQWHFNAWAKYENFSKDQKLPSFMAEQTKKKLIQATRLDGVTPFTLEGGAIETDGAGSLLVTEECLLSEIQQRNKSCSREEYQKLFSIYLGIKNTIWLEAGIPGDDTHGHIDDLARFVSDQAVLLVFDENDPEFKDVSRRNLSRLEKSKNARGEKLSVGLLPMPSPIYFEGEMMPASYANFYLGNNSVFVPIFKDRADDQALRVIDDAFSGRNTIPINCSNWIVGCGSLHCSTQPQFS